jgi:hypothetical protein
MNPIRHDAQIVFRRSGIGDVHFIAGAPGVAAVVNNRDAVGVILLHSQVGRGILGEFDFQVFGF